MKNEITKKLLLFLSALFCAVASATLLGVYIHPSTAVEKTQFFSMLGSVFGGTALLIGIYFTWRQLQITLDGKITDRLSQAIEHISSENLSVRLGGLYELERIAMDSKRDLSKIIEILCAFIRVNSLSLCVNRSIFSAAAERELSDEELAQIGQSQFNRPRLEEDIQACLQIIAKIAYLHRTTQENSLLISRNLFGVNIQGARLSNNSSLSYFFLDNSQLDHIAVPAGTSMIHSRICNSDLRGALLGGMNLSESDFSGSFMEYSDLREATLRKTRFLGSRLTSANLFKAKAEEANFNKAQLKDANLSKAILTKANLGFTNLIGASLIETDLRGVDLSCSNLSRADLKNANLNGSRLHKANLKNARNLTNEQLETSLLCKTILPDGEISNRDCRKMNIKLENS